MPSGKAEGQTDHWFHLCPDPKGEGCASRFLVLTRELSTLQDADAFAELGGPVLPAPTPPRVAVLGRARWGQPLPRPAA